jgi:hypothetical protein
VSSLRVVLACPGRVVVVPCRRVVVLPRGSSVLVLCVSSGLSEMGDGGTHRGVLRTTANDDKHVVVRRLVATSPMATWNLDLVGNREMMGGEVSCLTSHRRHLRPFVGAGRRFVSGGVRVRRLRVVRRLRLLILAVVAAGDVALPRCRSLCRWWLCAVVVGGRWRRRSMAAVSGSERRGGRGGGGARCRGWWLEKKGCCVLMTTNRASANAVARFGGGHPKTVLSEVSCYILKGLMV